MGKVGLGGDQLPASCPSLLGLLHGWYSERTFWETQSGAKSLEKPGEARPTASGLPAAPQGWTRGGGTSGEIPVVPRTCCVPARAVLLALPNTVNRGLPHTSEATESIPMYQRGKLKSRDVG